MTYRSVRSAAGELGISQPAVRRAIREGRIPAVEICGTWRIPATYFEELEVLAYGRTVARGAQPSRGLDSPAERRRSTGDWLDWLDWAAVPDRPEGDDDDWLDGGPA
jgi:excisionase family DNA binding protein